MDTIYFQAVDYEILATGFSGAKVKYYNATRMNLIILGKVVYMHYNKMMRKLVSGAPAITLSLTSLDGIADAKVSAAPITEETQETAADSTPVNKSILGGLVAIGLISALTDSGSKATASESPAKSSTTETQVSSSQAASPSAAVSAGLTADEKSAFDLLNADRQATGLPALKLNMDIVKVARAHGQDMINRNYFAHENPDGQSPFDRMRAAVSVSAMPAKIRRSTAASLLQNRHL